MKPFYYLFVFCFFSASAFSQVVNNLVIFCDDPEPFTLVMNGERYNDEPATKVKATNLTLPKYAYKIIFKNPDIKPVEAVFTFYDTGWECTFSINKKGKKKYKVDFLTQKRMEGFEDANPTQGNNNSTNTGTYVPPANNQTVSSTPTNTVFTGNGQNNNQSNQNQNTIRFGPLGIDLSKGTIGVNGKVAGVDMNVNEPLKKNKPTIMSDSAFTAHKKNIEKQETEEKKLAEAKAALEKNAYNTSQIKDVMGLLKTDEAKLDYAKSAYKHCKDQKKYKDLCDALTSDDSKKDLKKFIDKQEF